MTTDGPGVETYTDGTLMAEGNYAGGKRNREWIYHYRNGQRKAIGNLADDRFEGPWVWWRDGPRDKAFTS